MRYNDDLWNNEVQFHNSCYKDMKDKGLKWGKKYKEKRTQIWKIKDETGKNR